MYQIRMNRAIPSVLAVAAGCLLGCAAALAQSPAPSPMQQALNRGNEDEARNDNAALNQNAPRDANANEANANVAPASPASPSPAAPAGHGFLGVLVQPVGDALRDQLNGVLPPGVGVLVGQLEATSPAGKAGIKRHDVLIAIDGKPIAGPQDLVRRMRDVKPGQQLPIALIRGAQKQDVTVTAGEAPPPQREHRAVRAGWDEVRDLHIQKLAPEKLSVQFSFEGEDGKAVSRTFTGSRQDIRRQIEQDRQLSPARRGFVLESLRHIMRGAGTEDIESGEFFWNEPPDHRELRDLHDALMNDM